MPFDRCLPIVRKTVGNVYDNVIPPICLDCRTWQRPIEYLYCCLIAVWAENELLSIQPILSDDPGCGPGLVVIGVDIILTPAGTVIC